MDQTRPYPHSRRAPTRAANGLALIACRFALARPETAAPDEWDAGLAQLLGWLGIQAEHPAPGAPPLTPVFAPWLAWSPAAFQASGAPGLPAADFAASYCIDHVRGAALTHEAIDLVLFSPLPAACELPSGDCRIPRPRPDVLRAMLCAARAEGRERIAIICHAHQCHALAALLRGSGAGEFDILAIEDALPPLMSGRAPWDAIIAMPEWRSTVFTLIGQASGISKPWPMLWFAASEGRAELRLVTGEATGAGEGVLPLDAPALIHALALTLHEAGAGRAAVRLHEAWARLRDSGVSTAGRGATDGPYVKIVADVTFLAMLCQDAAVSKRPQRGWLALQNEKYANPGSKNPRLRVVS